MAPPSISCAKQLQTRAYERIRAHTWTVLSAWRRLKPELTSAGVLPAVAASSRGDDSSCPCIFLHKQRPSAGQPVRGTAWGPSHCPERTLGRGTVARHSGAAHRTAPTRSRATLQGQLPVHGLAPAPLLGHAGAQECWSLEPQGWSVASTPPLPQRCFHLRFKLVRKKKKTFKES